MHEMEEATHQTLEVNRPAFPHGLEIQIMHNVSSGPLALYKTVFPEGLKPTVTINCWPLTWHLARVADQYETGVHAVIPPQRSVPARLIDPKIKNRSRIYYQVANIQASKVDKDAMALLTDEDGFAAVNELGGFAILVGEMRETAARYRLLDVAEVHKWLEIE